MNKHGEFTYEFRPLPDFFRGGFRRYADGQWLPDDGEYDAAFISDWGAPICLYVELPYQRNIAWSGLTTHWTGNIDEHPRSNPWHYMLHEGETEWGGDWKKDRHFNSIAGDKGMKKLCSERSCANGRSVKFAIGDQHIAAGLLRIRETKDVIKFPAHLNCMYCGDLWQAAHSCKETEAA